MLKSSVCSCAAVLEKRGFNSPSVTDVTDIFSKMYPDFSVMVIEILSRKNICVKIYKMIV